MESEAIRVARVLKKIERKEIASKLGISPVAYGKIESGKTNAKKYLPLLREMLNPELDEILNTKAKDMVQIEVGYSDLFKIILPAVTEAKLYNQSSLGQDNNEVAEQIVSVTNTIAKKIHQHLNNLKQI